MSDLINSTGGVSAPDDPSSPAAAASRLRSLPPPSRILFVSANIGAGHHATARAVEQAAYRLWPDAETRWVDALDVMGPGVGPLFRQIYVTNVQRTPWLYEAFYGATWRYRWFALSSKGFVGVWCGLRLAPLMEDYAPDLVVSTHPFGSAALQWMRDHRGLEIPAAAWVSDFSPHPFWVYRNLDMHFVMHDACVPHARFAEPEAQVRVAAPPVSDSFTPGDRAVARDKLGLNQDSFVAVMSAGYFGFGTVEKAVETLLATDERIQIVTVCGHNDELRERLLARGAPSDRLVVLGWTDEMPAYMTAADVVLSNAGGATALEAMASGRAVLMFDPIAAHGRANAELMAEAGLALLCRGSNELRDAVRELLDQPDRLAELERTALEHAEARSREDDLRLVTGDKLTEAAHSGHPAPQRMPRLRPLQSEDAFFLYTDTPDVGQLLGGIVRLERPVDLDTAIAEIGSRLGGLPNLRRRLVSGQPGWRRPAWLYEQSIDLRPHVKEHVLGEEGEPGNVTALVDEFFSTPLDLRRPPWELHLFRDRGGDQAGLLVKLHHALGDGFAAMDSMAGLLEDIPDSSAEDARASAGPVPGARSSREKGAMLWQRARGIVTGTYDLARGGRAPRSGLNGSMADGRRRHAWLSIPVAEVKEISRAWGTGTNVVLLAVLSDGLGRMLDKRGERAPDSLRVMVPRTIRTHQTRHALGNITAAVPLDLPVGAISARARVAEVAARMERKLSGGQPEASRFLIKSMGLLPTPVHARVARLVYSERWFNAIVSVIPGPRRPQSFAGVRLTDVHPVLPLAGGVGLAVGLMRWDNDFAIGLTGDAALMDDVGSLAEAVREAFADFKDVAASGSAGG